MEIGDLFKGTLIKRYVGYAKLSVLDMPDTTVMEFVFHLLQIWYLTRNFLSASVIYNYKAVLTVWMKLFLSFHNRILMLS